MISEWELWACAQELIRQKGGDAMAHAVRRAADLAQGGDIAGAETWLLVLDRVKELSRSPTAADEIN